MSEQMPPQPPPLPATTSKRKCTSVKIIVGAIAGSFLVIALLGSTNSPSLEVRRRDAIIRDDRQELEVLNVGTKPLTITKIAINERDDCSVHRYPLTNDVRPLPAELKVGDRLILYSSCQVIRAAIETDQGSNTYSFSGQ
jgi:hypothetical protein